MTTYTLKSNDQAQASDGVFGFSDGTYDYLVGGWLGGSTTIKTFWRSADDGVTWVQQSDFAHIMHCPASCIVNGVAYCVGGDYYNKTQEGDYDRSSYKFQSGAWTQIAANCGMEDRCLGALAHLGGDFFLIGGQYNLTKASVYNTVMRSDDGCETFTTILADTTPYFKGGLLWGSCVEYKGEIWKIGGGVYTDDPCQREHRRAMFSTTDGITWTYRGEFRGLGRNYLQCVVLGDKIWVIDGYNDTYGGNLADVWTIEKLASGKIVQTYVGVPDFGERHAHTAWATNGGIMLFGGSENPGSTITRECWLITE